MKQQYTKVFRILDMYLRLCEGKVLNKKSEAVNFGVDERSIQRDIDDVRSFLSNRQSETGKEKRTIIYDRSKSGYVMSGNEFALMTNDEVLAVSKILLESRAFTKKEISVILDKLVSGCVPIENMKLVSELIANEKYHYIELRNKSNVTERLWKLGEEIKQHNLLEISYRRQASSDNVKRVIQPLALIFSEYYFYLNAFIVEKNAAGKFEKIYTYPAVFRIDRICSYRKLEEKFVIPYADRFEEGVFRKRVQFMYPGSLMKIRFRYTGTSVEAILDRLPTACVVSEDKSGTEIEAEVYGKGILMWLLSQGNCVEILKPQSMREEFKNILLQMLEKY